MKCATHRPKITIHTYHTQRLPALYKQDTNRKPGNFSRNAGCKPLANATSLHRSSPLQGTYAAHRRSRFIIYTTPLSAIFKQKCSLLPIWCTFLQSSATN